MSAGRGGGKRVAWAVFVVVLVLGGATGAVFAGVRLYATAVASDGLIERLRSPEGTPARAGLIVERAKVSPALGATFGACLMEHRKSTSGSYRPAAFVHGGSVVTLPSGKTIDVAAGVRVDAGSIEGPLPRSPTADEMAAADAAVLADPPLGFDLSRGNRRFSCLPAQAEVLVAGCVGAGGALEACAGSDGVLLSPTASPRDWLNDVRFGAALGFLGVVAGTLLALLAAWAYVGTAGVGRLAAHAAGKAAKEEKATWIVIGLVLVAATWVTSAVHVASGTVALIAGPSAMLILAVVELVRRRMQLKAAAHVLERATRAELGSLTAEHREIAIRVAADAPSAPVFQGDRAPLVALEIAGQKLVIPAMVAIEDRSGRGYFDVASAKLDDLEVTSSTPITQANANALLERLGSSARVPLRAATKTLPQVIRRDVAPGEGLLVLGDLEVKTTTAPRHESASGFREPDVAPLLSTQAAPLVVMRCEPGTLARKLSVERAVVTVAAIVALLVVCGGAFVEVWLQR